MSSDLEGMRAVLYARVSTDDKGQTTETQVREMKKWCEAKGVEIAGIYEEEKSATTLDRPKFQEMMGRILVSRDVQILLVYDQSRLTRDMNMRDIEKALEGTGCQIRYVDIDIEPGTVGAKITSAVKEVLNKEENDARKAKTKMGIETRRIAGYHVGRPRAFVFTDEIEVLPIGAYINASDPKNEDRIVKSKTMSKEYALSLADNGVSVRALSRIIGVAPSTFYDIMKKTTYKGKCFYDVYQEHYYGRLGIEYSPSKPENDVRKGLCSEKATEKGSLCTERGGSE